MTAPTMLARPAAVQTRPLPMDIGAVLAPHVRRMPAWKRTVDVAAALVGIAALAPVFLAVAFVVKLDSPGGAFFRQLRVGKGGQLFTCWKFRTMRQDAEELKAQLMELNEARGHIFKLKNDPRRTRVGVFLRKTSVDELPQLWNVLRGEMSLIGPRPPVPAEVANYSARELRRLAVEPGITGLWQVTLRGSHDFADMVTLDLEYAERRSIALDLKIYARTVTTVLKGEGSC